MEYFYILYTSVYFYLEEVGNKEEIEIFYVYCTTFYIFKFYIDVQKIL